MLLGSDHKTEPILRNKHMDIIYFGPVQYFYDYFSHQQLHL